MDGKQFDLLIIDDEHGRFAHRWFLGQEPPAKTVHDGKVYHHQGSMFPDGTAVYRLPKQPLSSVPPSAA